MSLKDVQGKLAVLHSRFEQRERRRRRPPAMNYKAVMMRLWRERERERNLAQQALIAKYEQKESRS